MNAVAGAPRFARQSWLRCNQLTDWRDDDCDLACAVDGVCGDSFIAGVWSCGAAGLRDLECGTCGDGFVTGAEQCDGASGAPTCADGGFTGPTPVGCTAACVPDFAGCTMLGDCCEETPGVPGCAESGIAQCVCADDPYCCAEEWDARCVGAVERLACAQCADG